MTTHPRTTSRRRATAAPPVVNRLLAGLPARARNDVLKHCDEVELTHGELLSEPAEVIRYAYFPADGFISLIATVGRHTNEVSLIGNEGMFSSSSVLGSDVSPLRALVQGAGGALRMKTADLRRAAHDHAMLRDTLNRYLCVVIAELAQSAVCNGYHTIEARLARWLLMTQDRAPFRSARADSRAAGDDARRAPQRHQRRRRRPTDSRSDPLSPRRNHDSGPRPSRGRFLRVLWGGQEDVSPVSRLAGAIHAAESALPIRRSQR